MKKYFLGFLFIAQRKLQHSFLLLILAGFSAGVTAIDPPPINPSRFAMKTTYLQTPEEGIYELAFDARNNRIFAAVMDRVNRQDNRGFLYGFNPGSLNMEGRYAMPYRAFSLAINQDSGHVYVGHTQSASLRISMVDGATGKILRVSERLTFDIKNIVDKRYEHLRHMVYSKAADALFVSYSNMVREGKQNRPVHKLLILDGKTLALKGEVKGAYQSTAYGLTADEKTRRIYIGGSDYVNEIDAVSRKVLRTITLQKTTPVMTSVQNLFVDTEQGRLFVVVFDHADRSGNNDGLYVFRLNDGKQLAYVHTGAGANAVKYNPKYNELYVTNFTSGTISVVDGNQYNIIREINMPVHPNQMALSADMDTLYVGIKEGFNRQWDPDVFVEGAREKILSISLKETQD
ncbi:YncE family protein [Intestinirhabdus alba]|jgi:YVTN family beta-propeller protein|uniref:TieB n=1 Tax=Intestinirhabdus alba TaxID=2899544 RepID=A0A6L6ISB0_9ENTR|nr:TieB [Intestinirhabdus alba]